MRQRALAVAAVCLAGVTLILVGIAVMYWPAALVAAGGCMVAVGVWLDRVLDRPPRRPIKPPNSGMRPMP